MINRSNYEIWFLDFFEGTLPEEDRNILFVFLENNPDLKKEFDEFKFLSLEKEPVNFDSKEKLKYNLNIETIQGLNEFETLAVKSLEEEITEEEKKELDSIIRFSSEKAKEYITFGKTILVPPKNLLYDQKEKLKKEDKKIIPLWVKYISSVAAILLLIFFIKNINSGKSNQIENKVEVVTSPEPEFKNVNKMPPELLPEEILTHTNQNIENTKTNSTSLPEKKYKNSGKSVVLPGKEIKNLINSKDFFVINIDKISLPETTKNILTMIRPGINKIYIPERKANTSIFVVNNSPKHTPVVKALTPKEFLIKKVKTGLDIDDKNYDEINPVEIASASLEKMSIGSLEYNKDSGNNKKHLVLNIGKFGIERIWQ
jgi:hypothetical protein